MIYGYNLKILLSFIKFPNAFLKIIFFKSQQEKQRKLRICVVNL